MAKSSPEILPGRKSRTLRYIYRATRDSLSLYRAALETVRICGRTSGRRHDENPGTTRTVSRSSRRTSDATRGSDCPATPRGPMGTGRKSRFSGSLAKKNLTPSGLRPSGVNFFSSFALEPGFFDRSPVRPPARGGHFVSATTSREFNQV